MQEPKEQLQAKAKRLIEKYHQQFKAKIVQDHILITMRDEDAHYWSPQMDFRIETDEDFPEQTSIAGLIGPRPPVWTLFVFIYFGLAAVGFFISSYGVSKWMLDEYSHTLWAFPMAVIFMLTAYKAGKYGESLGKDQIELLKGFIRELVAEEPVD